MSWWWATPLLVAIAGGASLAALARRGRVEAERAGRASEDLRATRAAIAEARRGLVLDLTRYDPEVATTPETPEQRPSHQ